MPSSIIARATLRALSSERSKAASRCAARSADPVAQRLAAFELSLGRARNVALAMMELGVDPETLQVAAASASEPAYDESQPSGEAGNRRVEIFLEY
jgi:hypothetical protein